MRRRALLATALPATVLGVGLGLPLVLLLALLSDDAAEIAAWEGRRSWDLAGIGWVGLVVVAAVVAA